MKITILSMDEDGFDLELDQEAEDFLQAAAIAELGESSTEEERKLVINKLLTSSLLDAINDLKEADET